MNRAQIIARWRVVADRRNVYTDGERDVAEWMLRSLSPETVWQWNATEEDVAFVRRVIERWLAVFA